MIYATPSQLQFDIGVYMLDQFLTKLCQIDTRLDYMFVSCEILSHVFFQWDLKSTAGPPFRGHEKECQKWLLAPAR